MEQKPYWQQVVVFGFCKSECIVVRSSRYRYGCYDARKEEDYELIWAGDFVKVT